MENSKHQRVLARISNFLKQSSLFYNFMVDVKNIDITYRFNIFLCLNQFFFTSYNVLGTHNGFCIQYNIICYTLGTYNNNSGTWIRRNVGILIRVSMVLQLFACFTVYEYLPMYYYIILYMHRSDRLQGKTYSSKHFRNGSVFVVQVFLSGRLLYALFRISKSSIVVGSDDSEGGGRWWT